MTTPRFAFEFSLNESLEAPAPRKLDYRDALDWLAEACRLGAVRIAIGEQRVVTSLSEVTQSLAGVVWHGLMDPFLTRQTSEWERILSEEWRLVLHHSNGRVSIELRKMSNLIAGDDEIASDEHDPVMIRDAIADLLDRVISRFESTNSWFRNSTGREVFQEKMRHFKEIDAL